MILPPTRTPLSADEAAKALSDGYKQVTGSKPKPKVLGLLLGQSALETGNWKSINNFNFGGVKGQIGKDLFVQYLPTHEIIDGQRVLLEPPDPRTIFRAHGNAADGAADYIKAIKNREHWWNGLKTGDVTKYVEGLTTKPFVYMTADPTVYRNVLSERMNQFSAYAKRYGSKPGLTLALSTIAVAVGGGLAYRRLSRG